MAFTLGFPWRVLFSRSNHQGRARTSKARTRRSSYVPGPDMLEDRSVPSALTVTNISNLGPGNAGTGLLRSNDGMTVDDINSGVNWLANANLAATKHFGVKHINPDGSMTWQTALNWVAAMNKHHYLGHTDWTLPPTTSSVQGCGIINPTSGFGFGFGCTGCAMGELFYTEFGATPGESISSISNSNTRLFENFQPYFYWSSTARMPGGATFSFGDGFENTNLDADVMYAIPEFPSAKNVNGPIPFKSPLPINKGIDAPKVRAAPSLVLSNDGTVYDAARKITWLANANLAATQTFGVPNINPDGSMDYHTATAWIDAMNKANDGMGYLGHTDWRLPVSNDSHGDYDIVSTDMGELFYTELGSKAGSTILLTSDQYARMFIDFQPYLYWSGTPTMNNPGDDGHSESHVNSENCWTKRVVCQHVMCPLIIQRE